MLCKSICSCCEMQHFHGNSVVVFFVFQVGSKTDCVMCLGPMVPDGYGICYNPMDDHINFAVTAFNSCEETNATRLSQFLEDSLLDMKTLLEQVSKTQ